MGVYIPNMKKERYCEECPLSGTRHIDIYDYVFCELLDEYVDEAKKHCPLIEIDLERDIPTVWYNRQTGQYEPKGTKQEVYERLYKLKNGERRADDTDNK